MAANYVVNHERLMEFCADLFISCGLEPEDAGAFAKALVDADLCGVKSHGTVRIKTYLAQIKAGQLNLDTRIDVERETPVTALINGNNGLGMVVAQRAVELARKKALESVIGFVCVKGANHFGTAKYWGRQLAGEDMVAFVVSNTTPILAAPQGSCRAIGSNPFAIAVPAGKYGHMCLDIANGVMAMGKIYEYVRLDMPLPEGSFLDKDGNPTTDPHANDVQDFIMRPFGGHKGFGLAVMMEAVSSILAGGAFCPQSEIIPTSPQRQPSLGQSFGAMRIDAFRDPKEFIEDIERFIEYLHGLPVKNGNAMRFPGELAAACRDKSTLAGIVLPGDIVEYLKSAANDVRMPVADDLFAECGG